MLRIQPEPNAEKSQLILMILHVLLLLLLQVSFRVRIGHRHRRDGKGVYPPQLDVKARCDKAALLAGAALLCCLPSYLHSIDLGAVLLAHFSLYCRTAAERDDETMVCCQSMPVSHARRLTRVLQLAPT
jgi:hypothetical protein